MNIRKVEDEGRQIGTFLVGYIDISYQELVNKFGEPELCHDRGNKTDAQWLMEFEDHELFTIYNYKNGINYEGSDGIPTEDIRDWHIGGSTQEVVRRLMFIFPDHEVTLA